MFRKIDKKYLAIFLTVAACIVFYFLVQNIASVWKAVGWLFGVFTPILIGFILAYLLDPILKVCERFFRWLSRKKPLKQKTVRILSLVATYLFALILVGVFILIVVPQLTDSFSTLADNLKSYTVRFSAWVDELTDKLSAPGKQTVLTRTLSNLLREGEGWINDFANKAVASIPDLMEFIQNVVVGLSDFVIGVFLSIYMLYDKEMLMARLKKLTLAVCRKKTGDRIILFFRDIDESVGSFINSKILDSIIVGVASYFIFLIAGIPYAALIALIVGVTNIIPVFGPFIGAIPGGLLLLMVAPGKVPIYVLLIIVIQQIDGNIIGPKIIGRATGVSDFWVLVSLTIAGSMFGVWGMVLAVPVFSLVYRLSRTAVNRVLEKKGLPIETHTYVEYPPHEPNPENIGVKQDPFFKRLFRRKKKEQKSEEAKTEETKAGEEKPHEDL